MYCYISKYKIAEQRIFGVKFLTTVIYRLTAVVIRFESTLIIWSIVYSRQVEINAKLPKSKKKELKDSST